MRTGIVSSIACINTPTSSNHHHGQSILVDDLATPNIFQIYGIPIDIEYTLSFSFTTLVSPTKALAIPLDAYYATYT